MQYRLGNSLRIKEKAQTEEIECPKCKNRVKFKMFSNMDIRLISEYPVLDPHTVYFLVCPKCAAVYTVEEDLGDELAKGEKRAVGDFDLKELKEFKK